MRDGAQLVSDLYLPRGLGRAPAVLYRTPYNTLTPVFSRMAVTLAQTGLAVILQNCRGRYGSTGVFVPFQQEGDDGLDTVDWLRAQPWFDGRLGLLGASYATYAGAAMLSVGLPGGVRTRAMVSLGGIFNPYAAVYLSPAVLTLHWAIPFLAIVNGTKQKATQVNWDELFRRFPALDWEAYVSPDLRRLATDCLGNPAENAYWRRLDLRCRTVAQVPTLHVGGWYDFLLPLTLDDFALLTRQCAGHDRHQLLIGPWDHRTLFLALARSAIGRALPGADRYATLRDGGFDLLAEIRRWFVSHLLPEQNQPQASESARVTVFVMNDVHHGSWRSLRDWPPPDGRAYRLYLHGGHSPQTRRHQGNLAEQLPSVAGQAVTRHEPGSPVPSVGGALWPIHDLEPGPLDQTSVEAREDVLGFDTAPLTAPLTLLGPVTATLWTQATEAVFDVAAKLVDVHPDGLAQILTDGITRSEQPAGEKGPRPVRIAMAATGHTVRSGHRLRLEVATCNFPKYDMVRTAYELTLHSGPAHPSCLEVTVADEPDGTAD